MIIYHDTEKELYASDYKPIQVSLKNESINSLYELLDNLEKAQENYWLYGNDIFALAIDNDIRKTELYIKFAEKKKA